MPPRTNSFQKMVLLAIKQRMPEGAVVTESKMLDDLQSGANREVDIYIEFEVGGIGMSAGVECTDSKNRKDLKWVEGLIAKHSRLGTNKLVV